MGRLIIVLCALIADVALLLRFGEPLFDFFLGKQPTFPGDAPAAKESTPPIDDRLQALRYQQDLLRLELCSLEAQENVLIVLANQQEDAKGPS